jgi:hypothetical protein
MEMRGRMMFRRTPPIAGFESAAGELSNPKHKQQNKNAYLLKEGT